MNNNFEQRRKACELLGHDPVAWPEVHRWLCQRCGLSFDISELPLIVRRGVNAVA